MLEINRIEKKSKQLVKFDDSQIYDKFTTHVDTGFFGKNLDEKVNKEMQEREERMRNKEEQKDSLSSKDYVNSL